MELTGAQARELKHSGGDPELGLTVEADELVDTDRWTSYHALVVRDRDGKFWEASYEQGLTEQQDTEPFEYEDSVEFYEVEKVPVTTFEYRRIA